MLETTTLFIIVHLQQRRGYNQTHIMQPWNSNPGPTGSYLIPYER